MDGSTDKRVRSGIPASCPRDPNCIESHAARTMVGAERLIPELDAARRARMHVEELTIKRYTAAETMFELLTRSGLSLKLFNVQLRPRPYEGSSW